MRRHLIITALTLYVSVTLQAADIPTNIASAVAGTKSAAAQNLHRIEEAFAKQDIESHGFKLEKTWDGYRNPSDDLSKNVFLPAVRGKTDRFTHLYRK